MESLPINPASPTAIMPVDGMTVETQTNLKTQAASHFGLDTVVRVVSVRGYTARLIAWNLATHHSMR